MSDGMALRPDDRDFDKKPYSDDEQRVADWLSARMPDVGTGSDPIGFVLASYEFLIAERNDLKQKLAMGTHIL